MTAKTGILGEIALEIDDNLKPERFLAAVRAFFGLTEELAQLSVQDSSGWRVKVREGSSVIVLEGVPDADSNAVHAAVNRTSEGANALIHGDFSSPVLTEKAIQFAKRLSDLTKDGPDVTPMRICLPGQSLTYGPDVADMIRKDEAASYDDYGTLEGTLKAIADNNGSLEIRIQDLLWRRSIPCRVSDEQIEDAIGAFRKRVEIAGMIRYSRAGSPKSIRMESLSILPDDSSLPTASDVRGLFAVEA